MTFDDFKAKHKENVLKGFDDLDGQDYWAEFKADLHTLLADERKALEPQIEALKNDLKKTTEGAIRFTQSSLCEEHQSKVKAQSFAEFVAENEGKCLHCALRLIERMTSSLNKIHDLAGQLGAHPHAGAIQDWVHQVLPCKETR